MKKIPLIRIITITTKVLARLPKIIRVVRRAVDEASPGGKRITLDEGHKITVAIGEEFMPIVLSELGISKIG